MTHRAFNEKTLYVVGPSYAEAKRRKNMYILWGTICVPALFVIFGVVGGRQDKIWDIVPFVTMTALIVGVVALFAWRVFDSRDDLVEQVELGEISLVLRRRFSECEIPYQGIWTITLYYQDIRTRYGYYHSHKRMELSINGISGGVGPYRLMERLAEDIRRRVAAVNGGVRVGDRNADREQRLAQKKQNLLYCRIVFALIMVLGAVLGAVAWHLHGESERAWERAPRVGGVVTGFSEDNMWLTVKYAFTDAAGKERTGSSSTSNDALRPRLTPGSAVTVKYLPDKPLAATIDMEGFDNTPWWIWAGMVFLAVCVLVGALAITGYDVAVVDGGLALVRPGALPEDYIRL